MKICISSNCVAVLVNKPQTSDSNAFMGTTSTPTAQGRCTVKCSRAHSSIFQAVLYTFPKCLMRQTFPREYPPIQGALILHLMAGETHVSMPSIFEQWIVAKNLKSEYLSAPVDATKAGKILILWFACQSGTCHLPFPSWLSILPPIATSRSL